MPKYDVTAIWTRSLIKVIEVEAGSEDEAWNQVKEELDRAIAGHGVPLDQADWDLESEDIDIESVDEAEAEAEAKAEGPGESEGEVAP